jgi:hypothetical protein
MILEYLLVMGLKICNLTRVIETVDPDFPVGCLIWLLRLLGWSGRAQAVLHGYQDREMPPKRYHVQVNTSFAPRFPVLCLSVLLTQTSRRLRLRGRMEQQ